MNDTLSVKDISEPCISFRFLRMHLFKSETGQTLNQYLTEYRMEKAKQPLLIPDTKFLRFLPK